MIRILKFLWTGSFHECKNDVIRDVLLHHGDGGLGRRYTLKCKECGKITKKDIK